MIVINIDALKGFGDVTLKDYAGWIEADSFAFGIEREMKQSGEKGGTEDINIGVGELQECTISKSMDRTSPLLAQFAINGNSPGPAEIVFLSASESGPVPYLKYKLDRCFVKSWSTSGDADDRPTEEIAFYYNKIAFIWSGQSTAFSWDRPKARTWPDHGLTFPPTPT